MSLFRARRTTASGAAIATLAMLASLVVAPSAAADPPPAEPAEGPYLDQALVGDPACDEESFPGSRTLVAERGQTFVPTRGELRHLHLCLTAGPVTATNDFTVRVIELATEQDPQDEDVVGFQQHRAAPGTSWHVVDLGTEAALTPGRPYRIEVLGPMVNGEPTQVENVAWRLSCTPGLLGNCATSEDRYPDGRAEGVTVAGNPDFGFRTLTSHEADLFATFVDLPRHVCPGRDVPITITAGDRGGGTVGASTVAVDLRGASGESLGVTTFDVPLLTPGATHTETRTVPVPAGFAGDHGRGRLGLVANAGDEVVEAAANRADNALDAERDTIVTACDASTISEITIAADRAAVPAGVGMLHADDLVADGVRFARPLSSTTGSSSPNGPTAYNPLPNGPTAYNPTDPNGPTAYNPTDRNGPTAYNPSPNGPTAYNPTDPNGPTAYNPTDPNGPTAYNPLARSPMLAAPLTVEPVDRSSVLHDAPGNARSFLFGMPLSVLGSIPLQELDLSRPGGWAGFLAEHVEAAVAAGTTPSPLASEPIQNLTLLDAMSLDPQPFPPVLHSHLGAESSILGQFSVAATSLGSTPLAAIPAPSGDWCSLATPAGIDCQSTSGGVELVVDGAVVTSPTLVTLDALGADLGGLDLGSAAHTLDQVAISTSSPLSSVQLALTQRTSAEDATLVDWALFDPSGTALASVVVDDTWADVLRCPATGCHGTLLDAHDANQFRTDASLGRLLARVPEHVRAQVTVEELIRGVVHDRRSLPWEHADLDGLLLADTALAQLTAQDPLVTWTASITADPAGAGLVDPAITVTLPTTFAAVPDTQVLAAPSDAAAAVVGVTAQGGTDGATAQVLTFATDLHLAPGQTATLSLAANAGAILGDDFAATAAAAGRDVFGDEYAAATAEGAAVEVVERFGPTSLDAAPVLPQDTLAFGHLLPGDRDLWRVPVPENPNWEVRITLSHVDVDADLVVGAATRDAILGNGPTAYNPLAVPNGPTAYNPTVDNGPTAYNPFTDPNGPTAYNPNPQPATVPEPGADWDATGDARDLPPQLLEDVPTDGPAFDKGVRAYSIGRGDTANAPESVAIHVTETEAGYYNVQVTGYNDASSPHYYVLRHHVIGAPRIDLGSCRDLAWSPVPDGRELPTVDTAPDVDPGTNTLFLVATQRLGGREGTTARDEVVARLEALAGRADLGIRGLVVPIEADPEVAAAYAAWDAARCDVHAANLASGRVRDLVMGYALEFPIENVVVVGDDELIPHLRFRDGATQGNERAFTSQVVDEIDDAAHANGTPATAALAAGMFLTDDHFGTPQAREWGDQGVFVPTMAVGRLAGDATAIVAALQDFVGSEGQVDPDLLVPADALGTGYAHNLDGGVATSDELEAGLGLPVTRLEDETWTAGDLTAAVGGLAAGTEPTILSLNGHADHERFLSAAGNASSSPAELVGTSLLADLPRGSIVFSMGCHFGWDHTTAFASHVTWRDAVEARRAILVANTGFNYGDSTEVGAGELFSALFARHLDGSMTVGQASAMAKAETYAREQGMERERLKAMQGMVFYGLPMYRIAASPDPAPPAEDPEGPTPLAAPGGQLSAHPLVLDFDFGFAPRAEADGVVQDLTTATSSLGIAVDRTTLSVDGRPVGPLAVLDVTDLLADPSLEFRGAVVRDLVSQDQQDVDAVFADTVVGRADDGRVRESLGVFPLEQASLDTVQTVLGRRTFLTVLPWTFRSTSAGADGVVTGDLRLDTRVVLDLLVAPKEPWDGVHVERVDVGRATTEGVGELSLTVVTRDAGGGDAADVVATYRDAITGDWHQASSTASSPLPGGRRSWSLTGEFPASTQPTELLVSAWTAHGVVGLWRNKGDLVDLAPPGTLDFDVVGEPGANGWYVGPVTIELPPLQPGESYEVRRAPGLDFEPFDGTTWTVDVDGVHVLGFRAPDGAAVEGIRIKLDQSAPTPSITSPEAGFHAFGTTLLVDHDCPPDAPSGLVSCEATLDGAPVADLAEVTPPQGLHTVTVTAVDAAGNVGVAEVAFTILPPPIDFDGFFSPVSNDRWNEVAVDDDDEGRSDDGDDDDDGLLSTVPFKWRLFRDGVLLSDTSLVTATRWQPVTCAPTAAEATATGPAAPATSTNGKGVWDNSSKMRFNAKIPAGAAGTCLRFDLDLADGRTESAWFRFRADG